VEQKSISQWWDQLDSPTQQWLTENPGCLVLPRAVVNAINEAAGGNISEDQHGESPLSPGDRAFIQAKTGQ
jgi:hypothetical protein